jgi:hypothetical protein
MDPARTSSLIPEWPEDLKLQTKAPTGWFKPLKKIFHSHNTSSVDVAAKILRIKSNKNSLEELCKAEDRDSVVKKLTQEISLNIRLRESPGSLTYEEARKKALEKSKGGKKASEKAAAIAEQIVLGILKETPEIFDSVDEKPS